MAVSHGYLPTCSTVYMFTIGHEVELLVVAVACEECRCVWGRCVIKIQARRETLRPVGLLLNVTAYHRARCVTVAISTDANCVMGVPVT